MAFDHITIPEWLPRKMYVQYFLKAINDLIDAWNTFSEPWKYRVLSEDLSINMLTATDIPGLDFEPVAGVNYEIAGCLYLQTTVLTAGVRIGLTWPTNSLDGIASIRIGTGVHVGNTALPILSSAVVLSTINQSFPCLIDAALKTRKNAPPTSGKFKAQMASGIAMQTVKVMAGSWIKYRALP